METEIGVIHLRAKECQELPVTNRGWKKQGRILSQSLQRKYSPVDTLILDWQPPEL